MMLYLHDVVVASLSFIGKKRYFCRLYPFKRNCRRFFVGIFAVLLSRIFLDVGDKDVVRLRRTSPGSSHVRSPSKAYESELRDRSRHAVTGLISLSLRRKGRTRLSETRKLEDICGRRTRLVLTRFRKYGRYMNLILFFFFFPLPSDDDHP